MRSPPATVRTSSTSARSAEGRRAPPTARRKPASAGSATSCATICVPTGSASPPCARRPRRPGPRTSPKRSGAPTTPPTGTPREISKSPDRSRGQATLAPDAAHEPEELAARPRVAAERAEQAGRHRRRVLLLHATHHHAQVSRVGHDTDALRLEDLLDRLG